MFDESKTVQSDSDSRPWISVIMLNYNGAAWLDRCMDSIANQTVFSKAQIIFADNQSTDGSDVRGKQLVENWSNGLFVQNGCNPGFGGGVNLAVRHATGRYLFFLNPDVWLEPRCLEELLLAAERAQAGVAGVFVLDYENNEIQSRGGIGFDITGHGVEPPKDCVPERLFLAHGFCFIRKDLFERVGGYDDLYFLYGEELDLCWNIPATPDFTASGLPPPRRGCQVPKVGAGQSTPKYSRAALTNNTWLENSKQV